jgi:hypothetical protein
MSKIDLNQRDSKKGSDLAKIGRWLKLGRSGFAFRVGRVEKPRKTSLMRPFLASRDA